MKKVSIVMPTRNRGHLLRSALNSALRQTYAPLEIVVCDNCSTDNTAEIVGAHSSRNVVYVRSNEVLSMPDNWERALRHVSGEYVTFLPDDSYLLQSAISMAMEQINARNATVAVWRPYAYLAFDWIEPGRRNVAYIPAVTWQAYFVNSAESLRRLRANDSHVYSLIPKSLNSLCHMSVIEKVVSVQGRFFSTPCPDYSSAVSVLLNVPEYLLIDYPLFIDGVTSSSIGASTIADLGKSAQEFAREFKRGVDDVGFLGIPTLASAILRAMQTVQALYVNGSAELDLRNWVHAITDDLARVEANGGQVTGYWKTLADHLTGQPLGVRLAVARQRFYSKLKWRIARKIWSFASLGSLETFARKHVRGAASMVRGDQAGFQDIEGCARFFEQALVSRGNPLIPRGRVTSDGILPLRHG